MSNSIIDSPPEEVIHAGQPPVDTEIAAPSAPLSTCVLDSNCPSVSAESTEASSIPTEPQKPLPWLIGSRRYCSAVQGARHKRLETPCQDATLAATMTFRGTEFTVLAVADGHGADAYPRSHMGAFCAVAAAQECLARLVSALEGAVSRPFANTLETAFRERLPIQLREAWLRRVETHLADHPMTEGEPSEAVRAYGTTIVLALILADRIHIGRIGDSSAHAITSQGYKGLAGYDSEDSVGVGTRSLAQGDITRHWHCESLNTADVALLALMSDGLTDSSEGLGQLLKNLHDKEAQTNNPTQFATELPDILNYYSSYGVGDDTSLVLWINSDFSHEQNSTNQPL